MKQSKRKIRKANIRKRTKKTNYRKNQIGGWGFFSRDPQIITDMVMLPNFENIQVSFPFKNIQMDISLPDKPLNQVIAEWAAISCLDKAKVTLENSGSSVNLNKTISMFQDEINSNLQKLSNFPPDSSEKIRLEGRNQNLSKQIQDYQLEIERNPIILENLDAQMKTPLDFNVIPDVVKFISEPYDISVFHSIPCLSTAPIRFHLITASPSIKRRYQCSSPAAILTATMKAPNTANSSWI